MPLQGRGHLQDFDIISANHFLGDGRAHPSRVVSGVMTCVVGVIRVVNLMLGQDGLQGALVVRQELGLLEQDEVVFVSKIRNDFVDARLIVGVPRKRRRVEGDEARAWNRVERGKRAALLNDISEKRNALFD